MSWRADPEYQDAERKWKATTDIRYAAIAIGRWRASSMYPDDPPEWALGACVNLWDTATAHMAPVIAKTQGGSPYADDERRVRYVATLRGTAGEQRSARQIFDEMLRREGFTDRDERRSQVQRLMNYYGREHLTEDGPMNHHIGRAAALFAREHRKRGLGHRKENAKI